MSFDGSNFLKGASWNLLRASQRLAKKVESGMTDWYAGIDDEILTIEYLAEQIKRVSKGRKPKTFGGNKMSWETLLVGYVYLDKDVGEADIKKMKRVISSVLEVKRNEINVNCNADSILDVSVGFTSLNWCSHVTNEKCSSFTRYALMLPFVKGVDMSLYYLSEEDFGISIDKKDDSYEKCCELAGPIEEEEDGWIAKEFYIWKELIPQIVANRLKK
jgi:hypothetical protein